MAIRYLAGIGNGIIFLVKGEIDVNNEAIRLLKMHGIGNDYVYADLMTVPQSLIDYFFSVIPEHEAGAGPAIRPETRPEPGSVPGIMNFEDGSEPGSVPGIMKSGNACAANSRLTNAAALAIRISDRHFGVGGDGLIMICPSDIADCKMKMYNSDGSEGRMCGNGIRCVGKFMYDNGYVKNDEVTVETLSGIKTLKLIVDNGICTGAKVDMGEPVVENKRIAVPADCGGKDGKSVSFGGRSLQFDTVCVDVGNPHCVIFVDDADSVDPADFGPIIENLPDFPQKTNVEFVSVNSGQTGERTPGGVRNACSIRMRVWERGTGITLACGTGATASAVAAITRGLCDRDKPVSVELDGGALLIEWDKSSNHAFMSGEAAYVFDIRNYDIGGFAAHSSAGLRG